MQFQYNGLENWCIYRQNRIEELKEQTTQLLCLMKVLLLILQFVAAADLITNWMREINEKLSYSIPQFIEWMIPFHCNQYCRNFLKISLSIFQCSMSVHFKIQCTEGSVSYIVPVTFSIIPFMIVYQLSCQTGISRSKKWIEIEWNWNWLSRRMG